jgi:hypothetical protein
MTIQKLLNKLVLIGLVATTVAPMTAHATTTLTARKVVLGNSAASATTTYTSTFTTSANENIQAVKFELCDSPLEGSTCTRPALGSLLGAGINTGGPTSSEFSGFSAGSGGQAATDTVFWATKGTAQAFSNATSYTLQLTNIANPSTTNYSYYIRITTYANANGTGQNEFGAVAVSTASQITVTGNMPESLVFCVGITISTDCTTIGGGTTVDFGTFSPLATNMGTSVMQASTNASSGYAITVNGTTMTSGINTIPAMGTQSANSLGCAPSCTSTTGVSQFGTNVRDNATPNVGANVSGVGTATGQGGYNTPDSFRYFSGDTVAGVGGASKANTFTNSYIVNVGGDQAAGQYTATMTYICTATF